MLKSLDELKAVVEYMRAQRVSAFRWENLEVTFASGDGAIAGQDAPLTDAPKTDDEIKREEEALLYHSAV